MSVSIGANVGNQMVFGLINEPATFQKLVIFFFF